MGRKAGVFGILVFLVLLSPLLAASCILDAEGFSSGGPPATNDASATSSGATSGSPGTSGGSSSGSTSGSIEVDGGDAGGFVGPNVLQNSDFEIGCASWEVAFGTVAESTPGRNGNGACKLCRGSNFEAFFGQNVKTPVPAESEWFGEIWLRTAADAGAGPNTTDGSLDVGYADGNSHRGAKSVGPPLTTEWQRIPMIVKPPLAGVELSLGIRIENGASCILVDDAVLRRTK